MSDLRDMLEEAAPDVQGSIPLEEISRRSRRRARRVIGARVAAVAVVGLAAVVLVVNLTRPTTVPVVDEPPPRSEARPVGGDLNLTMQPGYRLPDEIARDRFGQVAAGSAEVVTWLQSGWGRIEIITFERPDGGWCLSKSPLDASGYVPQPPDCADTLDDLLFEGALPGGSSYGCDVVQTALYVSDQQAYEVVVELDGGRTVSVLPLGGIAQIVYTGRWGEPVEARLYEFDGTLLDTASLEAGGHLEDCLQSGLQEGWHGTGQIEVSGARTGEWVLDLIDAARWHQAQSTLRLNLRSSTDSARLQGRLRFDDDGQLDHAAVRVDLPTNDPHRPAPRYDLTTDTACSASVSRLEPSEIVGRLSCVLPGGPNNERLEVHVDLALRGPAADDG